MSLDPTLQSAITTMQTALTNQQNTFQTSLLGVNASNKASLTLQQTNFETLIQADIASILARANTSFTNVNITTNENTRLASEALRVTAEINRVDAENIRIANETAKINNDAYRTTNETARLANEVVRLSSETSRGTAESNRNTAETNRSNSENTRVTAETTRNTSEGTRTNNETARVSAETARVTNNTNLTSIVNTLNANEPLRVTAENTRNTQEIARVVEETNRISRFNALTTAQQQASEVIDARTSTSKATTFGSLDERIESIEVDVTAPSYSVELTQTAPIFTLGKGLNSVGATIDVSTSVVNGKLDLSIEGNTSDIYVGGVKADFVGKVSGGVVENCNIGKYVSSASLLIPSSFSTEFTSSGWNNYSKINVLDTTTLGVETSINNQLPQQLFSFDIIKIYERKYGVIPSVTQGVTDKVAWLKLNLVTLTPNWVGYGSCPTGNKAYFSRFMSGAWNITDSTSSVNNTAIATLVSKLTSSSIPTMIQTDGFIHVLAHTDMASTTSPTLLVMSGHGLVVNDIVENVTRGILANVTVIGGTDRVVTSSVTGQASGDIINKFHTQVSTKVAEVGTTSTNIKITAHGLATGDFIANQSRGGVTYKITVVDVNNFTTTAIVGQVSGDSVKFYKYFGQQTAEGTSTTQLQLTAHGLVVGDYVQNVTRSVVNQVTTVGGTNTLKTLSVASQVSGDVIKKYHYLTSGETLGGTIPEHVNFANHGITDFGFMVNTTRGASSIVQIDDDSSLIVLTPIDGQTGQDTIVLYKLTGQQTAESGVIPSTIYTDYVSLDVTLKPSYKSVGEDFSGVVSSKVEVLSRGKNLFDKSKVTIGYFLDGNNNTTANVLYFYNPNYIMVKKSITYYVNNLFNILYYDVNKAYISSNTVLNAFVVPINCVFIRISGLVVNLNNIQLEEGSTATPHTPYTEDKRTLTLAKPLRRVSSTVADVYKSGKVARNVSEWVGLGGGLNWQYANNHIGYKRFDLGTFLNNGVLGAVNYVSKYEGKLINTGGVASSDCNSWHGTTVGNLVTTSSNVDTGLCDSYIPVPNEIKAYFYGYKMCHSDGVSPYQVSEVPYNSTTWAEWTKSSGVVGDSSGLEITASNPSYQTTTLPTNCKVSTKYGVLYNVVSNTFINTLITTGGAFSYVAIPSGLGNNKVILTSIASITSNYFGVQNGVNTEPTGNKIKLKDIRLFELPTGSQIETDFNTLTADQITAKYMFYGLNPKNWKSVVDGSGLTSVLPVAQAPNYTPYKMLYQLATPTIELVDTIGVDGYLPLDSFNKGSLVVDGGSISATTKYIVPLDYQAMGMDNNAVILAIKKYVTNLDEYTTNSLLTIADRELRMKAVTVLTTETTADLKAKINEIINIWKV